MTIFCLLLLAAHWMRSGSLVLVILTLALAPLVLIPRRWARWALLSILFLAAIEWVATGVSLAQSRAADGEPWLRAALILGSVAALNGVTGWLLVRRRSLAREP